MEIRNQLDVLGNANVGGKMDIANELIIGNYMDLGIYPSGSVPAKQKGRMYYDEGREAMTYYNGAAQQSMYLGQKLMIEARNRSGRGLYEREVVYISGGSNDTVPDMLPAQSNALSTARAVGMISEDLINNWGIGWVTTYGVVEGLSTGAYTLGQKLYVDPSTAGAITGTKPTQPNKAIRIGYVIKVHSSDGKIFVDPGREMNNFTANSVIHAGANGQLIEDPLFTYVGDQLILNDIVVNDRIEYSPVTSSGSGTVTLDLSQSEVHDHTLTGNITLDYTNPVPGRHIVILRQDATGGHTVTWATGQGAASAANVTIGQTANDITILNCYYDTVSGWMVIKEISDIQEL